MAHRKVNRYKFAIGNGYHDIITPTITAFTKAEALEAAKAYRGVPTDKITLWWEEPYLVLKRVGGKLQWVEITKK